MATLPMTAGAPPMAQQALPPGRPGGGVSPEGEVRVDWESIDASQLVENISLDPETESGIQGFLKSEIERSHKVMRSIQAQVIEFRKQYEEFREDKRFPWRDASNIEVAITSPHVNQVVGRNMRVLTSTTPAILVEAMPGISSEVTRPEFLLDVQDFINAKILQDDQFCDRLFELLLESAITGTGIGKVYWNSKERGIRKYGITNGVASIVRDNVIEWEGNRLDTVQVEDFYLPPEAVHNPRAIKEAHWVAHRYVERWGAVVEKVNAGIYRKEVLDTLFGIADQSSADSNNTFLDKAALRELGVPDSPDESSANHLVLYEVWCKYEIDGKETECVFVYSYSHDVLLSAKLNPFFHGMRPFVRLPYWPMSDSFYGRGIAAQLKHTQHAANDVLNAGIDALTLANTGVWEATKTAGIKTGRNDRIWAGRIVIVDEKDSIKRIDMGNPSPMTMEFVDRLDKIGQRASSVSDALTGGESAKGNRETAEGALARQGNSTPMFDVILGEIRKAVARIAEMYLANFQQYKPQGDDYVKMASGGSAIVSYLSLPTESVVNKLRFRVVASTVSANPEIRKATLQHFMAVSGPLFGEIMEAVKQMSDPNLIQDGALEIAKSSLKTRMSLANQLAHAYELPGAADMVPDFDKIWPQMEQGIMQARQQAAQSPKPMEDSLARAMAPDWADLSSDEQLEYLQRVGFRSGRRTQSEREPVEPAEQGMGQPEPFGAGGVA